MPELIIIGGYIVFLGAFAALGVFCFVLWRMYKHKNAPKNWPRVRVRIIGSDMVESRLNLETKFKTLYEPQVHYEYTLDGVTYACDQVTEKRITSSTINPVRKILARYPLGAEALAYVDPTDPENALLEVKPNVYYWIINAILLFVVAVLFVAFMYKVDIDRMISAFTG